MKALVYTGRSKIALKDRPKPEITAPADAIVRVTHTTICGTSSRATLQPSRRAAPLGMKALA